jgi:hypothetical protein
MSKKQITKLTVVYYMRHLWTKKETVDFRGQMYGPKTI